MIDYPYFSLRDLRETERTLAVSDATMGRYCKRTQKKRRKDARRNKLADTEAALGRANAELARSVSEKNALRNGVTKMWDKAAFDFGRADYAEAHPWRNLWAWVKRKLVRYE